jgi:Uma2 family endonuclease
MTETEILFAPDEIYRPDIAGWRRERLPVVPREIPLALRPDWVCEIISPSNERHDIIKKMLTYQRTGVPHYWLIDPILEALVVYRWTEQGYLLVQSAQREERIRAEPFDAVVLSVHDLIEGDGGDDDG